MTRYYGLPEANAALPDVERVLVALRDQRDALVELRDRLQDLEDDADVAGDAAAESNRLRLRMQGLVDQMQAGVARLVDQEIQLRDIATGLIDFPALASGRPIWLCWRLGEGPVAFWHGHDEGFAARRPLAELIDGLPIQ